MYGAPVDPSGRVHVPGLDHIYRGRYDRRAEAGAERRDEVAGHVVGERTAGAGSPP